MTARVALRDLRLGDVIRDHAAAGAVTAVTSLSWPRGSYRIVFDDHSFILGPGDLGVVTTREEPET